MQKIKEFSQKNSVTLFFTSVILLLILIGICFGSFGNKNNHGNFQGGNNQGIMRGVNNGGPSDDQTQNQDVPNTNPTDNTEQQQN